MTWPNVGVNQLNQLQGETSEVERCVLLRRWRLIPRVILTNCWVKVTAR